MTGNLLNATDERNLNKGSIVREAVTRWNESRFAVRGSQADGGTGGGEVDETVNKGN